MATQVQIRRGTNTQNASFTGAEGELSANTTNDSVHVHDGSTAGGFELARADLNNVSDTDLNAALTGNTLASLTITSADINGGNIDGTVIGDTTAAAGSFTTGAFSGSVIVETGTDPASITLRHTGNTSGLILKNFNGNEAQLVNVDSGPFVFKTNDTEAMRIDSSGRVGVGGVPNTNWRNDATDEVLMLGTEATLHSDAGVTTELWNNAYVNNSDTFKNISTRGASRYMQYSGEHKWFTAASASAGSTISTEINSSPKMVLDVNGNLGIGTSSPNTGLSVVTGSANGIELGQDSDASTDSARLFFSTSAGSNAIHSSSGAMRFFTGSTAGSSTGSECMRISSSGDLSLSDDNELFFNASSSSHETRLGWKYGGTLQSWIERDHANGGLAFGNQGAERMRIDSSGNVDIGSPAGSEKLSVAGSITADGYIYPTTDNGWSLGLSTNRWGNVYAYNGNFESTVLIGPGGGVSQLQIFPAFTSGVNLIQNYNGSAYTTEEHRASDYKFKIGTGDAVTIDSNGDVGINNSTVANTKFAVTGSVVGANFETTSSDSGHEAVIIKRTNSTGTAVAFLQGASQVGSISVTGSSTAYNTSSDQRLKENIQDAEDAGELIDAIQVRQFDWKVDGEHQRYGMVAQELTSVAPEAVSTPEDPDEMMGVDYSKLVPMLIKEIQTLRSRVAQLENN